MTIKTGQIPAKSSRATPLTSTDEGPVTQNKITELLDEIVQRIVTVSDPDQIILFGSYARAEAGRDSDLDLLVIKNEVDSTQAEAARIYRALADLAVPVDVVVVRTSYVQRYGDLVGTVVRPALREGKVLYAR